MFLLRMSNYLKIFQRSVLCFAVLLFVVPLVTQAATFPKTGTEFIPLSIMLKVWVSANAQVLTEPVNVEKGSDFTINWEATGRNVGNELTDTGITCVNNWGTDTSPKGSQTGSILATRSFLITCSGQGAARSFRKVVGTDAVDITVNTFTLTGLRTTNVVGTFLAVGDFAFKASLQNLGKASTGTTFRVSYLGTQNRDMTGTRIFKGQQDVVGIGGLAVKPLPDKPGGYAGLVGTGPWYFFACADSENTVSESNKTNNCSRVLGPLTFVEQ